MRPSTTAAALVGLTLLIASPEARARNSFREIDLLSDLPGRAALRDSNVANPWGIVVGQDGAFHVADNHTGLFTSYGGDGLPRGPVVTIPPAGDGAPTGFVWNPRRSHEDHSGGVFVFATENGTLAAWRPGQDGTQAVQVASDENAVYKGIGLGRVGSGSGYFVTNFHAGRVDIFDENYHRVTWNGAFQDAQIPDDYAPYNIRNIGGNLIVTYAKQDADRHDDINGAGFGFVDVFDAHGKLLQRLISHGALNAPWGLALAPRHFGAFGGALLVGNFGDGHINAFDPHTGAFLGALEGKTSEPIVLDGLWGLTFATGRGGHLARRLDGGGDDVEGEGGDDQGEKVNEGRDGDGSARLYFTAGINEEANGLVGYIAATGDDVKSAGEADGDTRAAIHVSPLGTNPLRLAGPTGMAFAVSVPGGGRVSLRVYDVSGRLVASPLQQFTISGESVVHWDGRDLRGAIVPAGAYFYRLTDGARTAGGRMVIAP